MKKKSAAKTSARKKAKAGKSVRVASRSAGLNRTKQRKGKSRVAKESSARAKRVVRAKRPLKRKTLKPRVARPRTAVIASTPPADTNAPDGPDSRAHSEEALVSAREDGDTGLNHDRQLDVDSRERPRHEGEDVERPGD
jgi:hypothetical protein